MTKRKGKGPIDVRGILEKKVRVKRGDTVSSMDPFDAELEGLVAKAVGGSVKHCGRFVRYCIKHGVIAKPEPYDDDYVDTIIPDDWDDDEYSAMFDRFGPPPWPGPRDGLTPEARERRKHLQRKRRA